MWNTIPKITLNKGIFTTSTTAFTYILARLISESIRKSTYNVEILPEIELGPAVRPAIEKT
jgi:hypothetical protein